MTTTVHKLHFFPGKTDQLLIRLQHLGGLVALESKGKGHPNAKWSIIAANPSSKISLDNSVSFTDAAENLKRLLSTSEKINSDLSNLPFTGGIIGSASYDLGSPHSGYRSNANNSPTLVAGYYPWAFLLDHLKKESYLLIENNKSKNTKDELIKIFLDSQESNTDTTLKVGHFKPVTSRKEYLNSYNKTQEYIRNGDVYQINLTQAFKADYSGKPLHGYLKLASQSKSPFLSYLEINKDHAIASVSPELFLSIDSTTITTKPIKGTIPRSENPVIDKENIKKLSSSKKDYAENLMIVDLLRNDLSISCENVSVPHLFNIESFELVHHLVSEVKGDLKKNINPIDAFLNAFPGGSITGAPKRRAMEIINEVESADRGFYCGSVFYFSNNNKHQSNILIRTFIFEDGTVTCNAGGGIVADSVCELEYKESLDKISKLMETLEN